MYYYLLGTIRICSKLSSRPRLCPLVNGVAGAHRVLVSSCRHSPHKLGRWGPARTLMYRARSKFQYVLPSWYPTLLGRGEADHDESKRELARQLGAALAPVNSGVDGLIDAA